MGDIIIAKNVINGCEQYHAIAGGLATMDRYPPNDCSKRTAYKGAQRIHYANNYHCRAHC